MTLEEAIKKCLTELEKAENKHPKWPTDPIHAAGNMVEEAGETMQACIDACYVDEQWIADAATEAAQTGAMALRFLIGMDDYVCEPGEQK
jgi:hypothetical protein